MLRLFLFEVLYLTFVLSCRCVAASFGASVACIHRGWEKKESRNRKTCEEKVGISGGYLLSQVLFVFRRVEKKKRSQDRAA